MGVVHGRGACMVRGVCMAGGPTCMVGGVWQGGHAWQGGMHAMADTTGYGQWAGGTHPTSMYSCWINLNFLTSKVVAMLKPLAHAPHSRLTSHMVKVSLVNIFPQKATWKLELRGRGHASPTPPKSANDCSANISRWLKGMRCTLMTKPTELKSVLVPILHNMLNYCAREGYQIRTPVLLSITRI